MLPAVDGDVLAPEPVSAPDVVHLLDGHPLRLRQEERDECGHDEHPPGEEVEEPELERAQHGEERLPDDEGERHVDAHGDALPRRPDLQREHLRRHQPPQRPPRPREAGDVEADEEHQQPRVVPGHGAHAGGAELRRDHGAHHDLRDEHLRAALEEQRPPPQPVDAHDGHHGGEHVHQPRDDGRHQRRVVAEADGQEQHRRVEHDHVDPRQLLEARDERRHGQLGAVPALQDVPPWVLDGARLLARRHHVVVLVVHVVGAADLHQHLLGVVVVATGDEGVGRVREHQRAHRDDERRHAGEAQADAPPPPALDFHRPEVDQVRREDADGGHELEADVEHAAELGGGHLREVERHRLVGEADADAEEDAAHDEHHHVGGGAVHGGAGHEGEPAAEHGPLAAEHAGHGRRHERRRQRRQVERRREERQQLAVELAVLVGVLVGLRLGVHGGEELLEERVHGGDTAGDADVVAEDEPAGGGHEAGEEDERRHVAGVRLAPGRVHYHAARHYCTRETRGSECKETRGGRRGAPAAGGGDARRILFMEEGGGRRSILSSRAVHAGTDGGDAAAISDHSLALPRKLLKLARRVYPHVPVVIN